MYQNYKVVVNTAAGRRRYMQYLIPYVVSSPIVDRYDIWINTHNGADIEFFKRIAQKFPIVNLVWQPDGIVNGNKSINAFYKDCTEEDTIYFKLDDDIIWMEPNLIEKMVTFRVDNPEYFLVTPLVINNSLSTYLLQVSDKLKLNQYYEAASGHPILWESGNFAKELHHWFIDRYLLTNQWEHLHIGKKIMGMTRFSINSVLWFGSEMRKFSGIVPNDDEEFLSCLYPAQAGLANAWNGDAIVAHFAFFTQRETLDKQGILERYGVLLQKQWHEKKEKATVYDGVQRVMEEIQREEKELIQRPSPYRHIIPVVTLRQRIKKFLPQVLLEVKAFLVHRKEKTSSGYILK